MKNETKMAPEEYDAMNIHTPIISFLICVGLCTNSMFLMSLKADKPKISYSEKIQVYKTSLVMMAIISYIPIELWVMQTGHITMAGCIVKDIFQGVFLDSFPLGVLAISITHFRLALCNGNSNKYVSRTFFIFIITGCSTISMFTAILKLIFVVTMGTPVETTDTNSTQNMERIYCYQYGNPVHNNVKVVGIAIMYVIPVVLVIVMYTRILCSTSESITRVQRFRISENESQNGRVVGRQSLTPLSASQSIPPVGVIGRQSLTPNVASQSTQNVTDELNGAKIWRFITTLVGVFLVVTIPVSTIEIFLCIDPHSRTLRIILLYLKTIMCIFHAVGEGIFHFEQRQRTRLFLDKHVIGAPTTTTLTRRNSFENGVVPTAIFRPVANLSTLNEVSSTTNSCKIYGEQKQDDDVSSVNNIPKEYHNQAFLDGTNHLQKVLTKQRSEDEVKTKEPYYCWEATDQLHGSRNANSPKKSIRSRIGSAFMNHSIPHTPYSTMNVSPNTRRLKHRKLQSYGSEFDADDSVFSYTEIPFAFPNRINMDTHPCIIPGSRERTTSVRTLDIEDIIESQEIKMVQDSIRALSAISDTM